MNPEERPTSGYERSSRQRLIAGGLLIIILGLILTGIVDDVSWAYVGFTLRHGG